MVSRTGIGAGIGIPFKNNALKGDKPYLPPEIKDSLKAVVIAYGKTNNDSDRAIVKNLVDPDNPFVISNAAFKLNSGFGKYAADFLDWTSSKDAQKTSFEVKITSSNYKENWVAYKAPNTTFKAMKVRISGIPDGGHLQFFRATADGGGIKMVNGINEIPAFTNTVAAGFYIDISLGFDWSNLVIEQIPSFEGAFVTDGVNDLITSTKTVQEMLGGSNEITVVSMIHGIGSKNAYTNVLRESGSNYIKNTSTADGKTGIYGYTCKDTTKSIITDILGDKNDYKLEYIQTSTPSTINSVFSVAGWRDNSVSMVVYPIAWYWTIIANKVLTSDQINQVIAYFNLDRTLKPDILCNTIKQGITNENHAEFGDKLIDFSGNGRDIQLNNLAWKGNSGIGKYAADFTSWTTPKEVQKTSDTVKITTEHTEHWVAYLAPNNTFKSMKVLISGIPDGGALQFFRTAADGGGIKMVNGINEIPEFTNTVAAGFYIDVPLGFDWSNLVIEQIPSHAGALCLDGANDFGKVTGMPIYKDYTFIIDYERISYTSPEVWTASVASKAHTVGQGAFILGAANREVELLKQSVSFGSTTTFNRDDFTRTLLYQSKYKSGDVNLTIGEGIDGDTLWLGTIRDNDYRFFNGAIYSLMSFPYSMSEFLIERQLKKHKLGTLYPDMVEFRPVIKHDDRITAIKYYHIKGSSCINLKPGDYIPVGSKISITTNLKSPYTIANVMSSSLTDIKVVPSAGGGNAYDILGYVTDKSPQKITMDIQVDSSLVQWNPVVESNVPYKSIRYYKLGDSSSGWMRINIGDYITIGRTIMITIDTVNTVDELVSAVSSQLTGIDINGSNGTYNITGTLTSESPQNINITIDEYIRYEDIVQPYPSFVKLENLDRTYTYTWGDKLKVGDTIRYNSSKNLLEGAYTLRGELECNGVYVFDNNQQIVVTKEMVFAWTHSPIWNIDDNEPKVILSPSRLRIPNSSYKILGYIPDISGHGNHGKINNSAYAEGSGVNEDGSYQFDGVDDFVTIPTIVGGKQVLMKVNLPRLNTIIYDQRKETDTYTFAILTASSQIAYDQRNSERITYIDGILNTNIIAEQLMGVTHNIVVINSKANLDNTRSPILGRDINGNNWSRMRIYDFMLFESISTDDKIKELNEYVGIEAKVELPPYYWDTYGKTNFDADRDTIQQRGVAVGNYDLTNYNHAYDKMSGYGGYSFSPFSNTNDWQLSSSDDTIELLSIDGYSFTARRLEGSTWWKYRNKVTTNVSKSLTIKIRTNKSVRINWELKYRTSKMPDADSTLGLVSTLLSPNVITDVVLPVKTEEELNTLGAISHFYLIFFPPVDVPVGEEYTVEMLPLYPNGLLYDAVTDYSENVNIPVFTDFTAIMKRKWLKNQGCPLIKGSKVYEGGNGNALLFEWDKAYNFVFYKRTDIMEGEVPDNISFITPTNYNGNVITRGSEQDTNGICIAGDGNAGFANMVFYKLILYPKTIPLLQINFLKNLMERDEIIDLNNPIFIQE